MTDEYINTELAHLKRLRKELPLMRKENKRLTGFIKDAAAFMRWALANRIITPRDMLMTLSHDLHGLANDEPCFVPRVTGYAEKERKSACKCEAAL